MKLEQYCCNAQSEWALASGSLGTAQAQLLLVFGSREVLADPEKRQWLQARYPQAALLGCSSAGEICGTQVFDDTLVATAIHFENTPIQLVEADIGDTGDSYKAGEMLARLLEPKGLVHVLVLSDGIQVNGSKLVKGLRAGLPEQVDVTGGLAGDGARFQTTLVLTNQGAHSGRIALLGFYGDQIQVNCGTLGGWDPFGPERVITRSHDNVLFELDGQSALALYKTYLGDQAADLPASGLLFPIELKVEGAQSGIVRTILAVNEADQSMTFAGDMPQGAKARLMKANFDRLIEGAITAAEKCGSGPGTAPAELAILISCVGRKLILKQRTEEEVEGAQDALGQDTVMTGFYSYGEISPFTQGGSCELHNQTMTITTLSERTR